MFDSCICVDPGEVSTLLSRRRRKARKPHRCGECGYIIPPGQEYEIDVTVFEGDLESHKTCIPCVRVRDSLFNCGWYYGHIWDDVHEAICDEDECVCPLAETEGTKP